MLIQIVFISIRSIFFHDTVTLSGCQDCSISKVSKVPSFSLIRISRM